MFPLGDCFYIGPACDVPSWRHRQEKVNSEGKTPLQTKGLGFSLLVYLEFDGWLFFQVNDSTPSNRRDRGKGKGASRLARSAHLLSRNGFPAETPGMESV